MPYIRLTQIILDCLHLRRTSKQTNPTLRLCAFQNLWTGIIINQLIAMEGFKSYFGRSGTIEIKLIYHFHKNALIYYILGHVPVGKFMLSFSCRE